jgi:hypothetical protein
MQIWCYLDELCFIKYLNFLVLYAFCYFCLYRFVWLDKVKFTLDGVIGHPYGSTFKVTNGEMVKVNKSEVNEAFQCKNI